MLFTSRVCTSARALPKHTVPAGPRSLTQNNVHIREKGLDKICGAINQELTTQRLSPNCIARRLKVLSTLVMRTPARSSSSSRRKASCCFPRPEASFSGQWDLDRLRRIPTLPSTPPMSSKRLFNDEIRDKSGRRRGAISDRSTMAATDDLWMVLKAYLVLAKPFLHFL